MADRFEEHVALVQDLLLELTRAANYVCDKARERLVPSFRIREGVLLVQGGPYMDMSFRTYRLEYRGPERVLRPYPGLENFGSVRYVRDLSFGEDPSEDPSSD